jgi:putative peptidoglycan lipid II flippase
MLDQFLAQIASEWAAGVIGYAERLMDLPLGVIGVAFGTVLLPTFAGLFAKNDVAGARAAWAGSVKSLLFVMLPSAAGLFVLAPEITGVIYEGSAFDAVATVRVSRAVAVYALGLGIFGVQKTLVPWFHAQNDMKTPLRVSLVTVCLNAVLNILAVTLLPVEFRHVGLAASTVLCAAVGCAILLVLAKRRNGSLGLRALVRPVSLMFAASVAMGAVIFSVRPLAAAACAPLGAKVGPIASLGLLIGAGMATYGVCALVLLRDSVRALLHRRRA